MIATMARAGTVLGDELYIKAARRAADFVLGTLRREDGRLLKRYRDHSAGLPAHLEDYAFLIYGLLNLYEATFEANYLEEAIDLNDLALKALLGRQGWRLFYDSRRRRKTACTTQGNIRRRHPVRKLCCCNESTKDCTNDWTQRT